MIELGHMRLNKDAQLACDSSPHYLLVDINAALEDPHIVLRPLELSTKH
jgi:hypothetical protein